MTTLTTTDNETRKPSTAMNLNGATKMRLIQEALSRARMPRPQRDRAPEAYRSARQIAMEARRRTAREISGEF